jgi:hypothetical protein
LVVSHPYSSRETNWRTLLGDNKEHNNKTKQYRHIGITNKLEPKIWEHYKNETDNNC